MKYIVLIFFFITVGLGEIVHRNYRKDGVKEFQIIKYVKDNKCDCSCKCNPQSQLKLFIESTTDTPISKSSLEQDDVTKNVKNTNLEDILSSNGKKNKMIAIDVSAETNIVTDEVTQVKTVNPTVTPSMKPSHIESSNKFEVTSSSSSLTTSPETTLFQKEFPTTKVNEKESISTENIDITSIVTTDEIDDLTTTILPILKNQLTKDFDQDTITISTTIENTINPVTDEVLNIPKSDEMKKEESELNKDSLPSSIVTIDSVLLTSTEATLPNDSVLTTSALPEVLSTKKTSTDETLHTSSFMETSQSKSTTTETDSEEDEDDEDNEIETTTFSKKTSPKIKEIAENESTDVSIEESTVFTSKNQEENDITSTKMVNDITTTPTHKILSTEKVKEKNKIINELGLQISDSNNTNSEEDIPEAEFSDTEKSEHITNKITNTTINSQEEEITTQTSKVVKTTLPIINVDIKSIINNLTTTTIKTTTEDDSEDVAFKMEETDEESLEEVTEILTSTMLTTPSTTIASTTKNIEIFNASEVIEKIDIVTEKVDKLDSLDDQLTKEIYNLVSEIRSKFENTSTTLKINENDQRFIQVKWSKLINKLREKLAKLQIKKINEEEEEKTGSTEVLVPQTTTPTIKIFLKKYKEQIKSDFSIDENKDEEKKMEVINFEENNLEKAKDLRKKQENAEDEEKMSIEKTLDALAEKERLLREEADQKRLHFAPNYLNKVKTISDTTLIRQPVRRGPTPEDIEDTIKLPQIQCEPVRNFIKIFKINDPKLWIQENCQFVKQYFPSASCVQIKDILISCL
ncbi:Hypothetical protein SRAE_1000247900 [Strongyloides ratti]|uniref:aECM cysteine-cradle domain-containing protein n=1 Tax=Strongyloides ratti TaxID=34506 RepID=A0A090MWT1_STRRB|nr:Hypothetical protein SRAE_1000247900 [Strongyloides ratti]CEF64224.1 Hypothetical protein SRAE_1000247900 [Strongyloides ratti]